MSQAEATSANTNGAASPECLCRHCGLPVPPGRGENADELSFCCSGCEFVYSTINNLGLCEFYDIRNSVPDEEKRQAVVSSQSFLHFDDPEFAAQYGTKNNNDGTARYEFYLEGMHCTACIWLIERLPDILPGLTSCRANFTTSSVVLTHQPEVLPLSTIAAQLDRFGYTPHPVAQAESRNLRTGEQRKALLQIGVAAACAGNTMMIAISLYEGMFSGIEHRYEVFFNFISLLITLPAILYSARPFYRAALAGLRYRRIHIDLPLSIGIIFGFILSTVNVIKGSGHIYYDSICMLIFLLLSGRWFQRRSVDRAVTSAELMNSITPLDAIVTDDENSGDNRRQVFIGTLKKGMKVIVGSSQRIPVDGVIIKGSTSINTATLTGESIPIEAITGDTVFAGTKNVGSEIVVEVHHSGGETRIGRLLSSVEHNSSGKASIIEVTDRLSARFVFIVLGLALFTFVFWLWFGGLDEAFGNTLALLVITCPCAIGLAAPVALSVASRRAAANGIFFTGTDVIEKLSRIREIYFDKTGTLTNGRPEVVASMNAGIFNNENRSELTPLLAITSSSSHPLASGIRTWLLSNLGDSVGGEMFRARNVPPPGSNEQTPWHSVAGKGLHGRAADGSDYILGSLAWLEDNQVRLSPSDIAWLNNQAQAGNSIVAFAKEGELKNAFALKDNLHPESPALIDYFRKNDVKTFIVSGDNKGAVLRVATELSIPADHALSGQSPEDKTNFVEQRKTLAEGAMVGDGVNDAAALKSAFVGIGVHGGAEICLRIADIFINGSGPLAIAEASRGCQKTMRNIDTILRFSLFYNIIGGSAAVAGFVSPLFAAILMPLSSVTVVSLSLLLPGFRKPLPATSQTTASRTQTTR
ncbi:MAG: heavy metal translocating P-type ATPase [bacterium]|nr:heavy metal translocating P-type ATPase [bacterium]